MNLRHDKLTELLLAARCPDPGCDGFGTVEGVFTGTIAVWCGNAIEGQVWIDGPEPCQWCHERAELLDRQDLLECPNTMPPEIDDIDNELPFLDG